MPALSCTFNKGPLSKIMEVVDNSKSSPPIGQLWDDCHLFPPLREIKFPNYISHVTVYRAIESEYHFLHESCLAFHQGKLHVGWANGKQREVNVANELYRGVYTSDGGKTWSGPQRISPLGQESLESCYNHGVMSSHDDSLWALMACHEERTLQGMAACRYDDQTGKWSDQGLVSPAFIPFDRPKQIDNQNWIIGGETGFVDNPSPAVAICENHDFKSWRIVPIPFPECFNLITPETTVIPWESGLLLAISRFENQKKSEKVPGFDFPPNRWAMVSHSTDCGNTWSMAQVSNLPLWPSKPFGDVLSNGARFLIFNAVDPENESNRRNTLVIAIAPLGKAYFTKIFKIQDGPSPTHAFYRNPQWSYPYAIEHQRKLYITYSSNKSDCVLSIIPVDNLS